ncbi:hypothetical protein HPB49_007293 [Dermacentor silvarum]|uniref:Uncharacterized protein n=1 Tax=Dermacentor silvarum TaxID=543639 RepID=A0ACB8D373_DERSI|nr:hypothetical protein HPB49_007293 [Dermacentor silvarum]
MTMEVLKVVEHVGFRVVRIVTDNHQTNVALFKRLNEDGTLYHAVQHPLREGAPLCLSFDPNHLIKNIRTNFLERELTDGKEAIRGGTYLKKLLEIQAHLLVKPVRFLTRSHVEPNNLEKMKVSRATQVFSDVVIGTLKYLQEHPQCHPDAEEFQECSATIEFMKMVAKWYALHDIGSVRAHGPYSKFEAPNEEPFMTTNDERLSWLEVDFISYLEEVQRSGSKSRNRMTKETYEATVMTTRSTVALIEYLLDHVNFRHVLTRGLNSDPVESLFSCFRQYNDGNDRVDARAAVFTAEKLLKVGILQAAKNGNAPVSSEANAPIKMAVKNQGPPPIPSGLLLVARELVSELEFLSSWSDTRADIEPAPIAYLAGYLVRVPVKKRFSARLAKLSCSFSRQTTHCTV